MSFSYKGKKSHYTRPGKMKQTRNLSATLWQSRWNRWQLIVIHSSNELCEITPELEKKVAYCLTIKIQHDGALSLPDVRSFIYSLQSTRDTCRLLPWQVVFTSLVLACTSHSRGTTTVFSYCRWVSRRLSFPIITSFCAELQLKLRQSYYRWGPRCREEKHFISRS